MNVLEVQDIDKIYPGPPPIHALSHVAFQLRQGDFAAVIGPSGSGKTTFLNIASGLDRPSAGQIFFCGREITNLNETELSHLRQFDLGFIFQSYNLFSSLTAVENIEYTCLLRGEAPAVARDKATKALHLVGLAGRENAFPTQMSGGQQQRVAVARAIAGEPKIIFADEPTANLDTRAAQDLIALFVTINAQLGTTFLFSTHDLRLVNEVRTKIEMEDGKIKKIS